MITLKTITVMIANSFYTDYELYRTGDLKDLEDNLTTYFIEGVYNIDQDKHELIGSQDDIDTETALKMADEVIFIDNYAPEEADA